MGLPTEEENSNNLALQDILENGKSINAALMRLVDALGGEIELSDTNAQLIDKLVLLLANLLGNSGTDDPVIDPGIPS